MSGVEFCDSTGMNVLLSALKRMRERGGALEVAAPRPAVTQDPSGHRSRLGVHRARDPAGAADDLASGLAPHGRKRALPRPEAFDDGTAVIIPAKDESRPDRGHRGRRPGAPRRRPGRGRRRRLDRRDGPMARAGAARRTAQPQPRQGRGDGERCGGRAPARRARRHATCSSSTPTWPRPPAAAAPLIEPVRAGSADMTIAVFVPAGQARRPRLRRAAGARRHQARDRLGPASR